MCSASTAGGSARWRCLCPGATTTASPEATTPRPTGRPWAANRFCPLPPAEFAIPGSVDIPDDCRRRPGGHNRLCRSARRLSSVGPTTVASRPPRHAARASAAWPERFGTPAENRPVVAGVDGTIRKRPAPSRSVRLPNRRNTRSCSAGPRTTVAASSAKPPETAARPDGLASKPGG